MKISLHSLSWVLQYLDFSHFPNPPIGQEEYEGFYHLSINAVIYTFQIWWELNRVTTSHATMLEVWIRMVWVGHHHEEHKMTWLPLCFCERVTYFIYFDSSSWRSKYFKIKNWLVRHINGQSPEIEYLTHTISYLGFQWGSHVKGSPMISGRTLTSNFLMVMSTLYPIFWLGRLLDYALVVIDEL